jgi:DNA polymerase III subunit beta
MNILCDREKLRDALALVNNVIPAKSTKPVLETVNLVATDDTLELVGTDLEVSIRYRIEDVKVTEPGLAVVPARVTLDFIRDLSGETVMLETHDNNCRITSGTDACELVTIDPDEFPAIPRCNTSRTLSIQGGVFTALVNRTTFAAAREGGRYAMHGILTEVDNGMLKLVATDGRRLALSETPIEAKEPPRPAIIPTKGMQLFSRVIEDPLEQVELHFDENQVGLRTANAEIFARLIDGEFPRYAGVIPGEARYAMEADASVLTQKLRLVANVTGTEARAVRLSMEKGKLELFGQSVGRGEAHAHMDVDYKGEKAEIAFNPDYVVEGLKSCESAVVRLEFNDRTSPGKFTLGESYLYVVMPITIDT